MTPEMYNQLLETLIEISNWDDPDEFTVSVERRQEIYRQYAGILQSKLDLVPARYRDDINRMITELQSRIDNDEVFLKRSDVRKQLPEILLAIRRGLRDGRKEQLRSVKVYWQNMLVEIAASGEVTSDGV